MAKQWLMLIYKIPREPTSGRVYVWRKLKQLGALAIQDAVWVLPATSRTEEQLRWLAAEIVELGGEATMWRSELTSQQQEADIVKHFTQEVEAIYNDILKALKRTKRDLADLARKYQQAKIKDYYHSSLGAKVRDALLKAGSERSG